MMAGNIRVFSVLLFSSLTSARNNLRAQTLHVGSLEKREAETKYVLIFPTIVQLFQPVIIANRSNGFCKVAELLTRGVDDIDVQVKAMILVH